MTTDKRKLKRWYVITPEYGTMDVICDGQGPMEYGCDVIEIQAATKRDALLLGVKEMRRLKYEWFRYADENPYAGVKVERPFIQQCQ